MAGVVVVLGAAGVIGRFVVERLAESNEVAEVVAADVDTDAAEELTAIDDSVSFERVDVTDSSSSHEILREADVVVNCVGPFYRFAEEILEQVIEAEVDYVDICDDYDVTRTLLDDYDDEARDAGVTAIVGLGASPGITNLLAATGASRLDSVDSIDVRVTRSITDGAGAAIPYHLFHSWLGEVPTYRNGEFETATGLQTGGETERFPEPFGQVPVFDFGHPESVTLSRTFSVDRVTTRGNFLPTAFREDLLDMYDLGLMGETPVEVGDASIRPVDFTAQFLERVGARLSLDDAAESLPEGGAVVVEVAGESEDEPVRFRFSGTAKMREGTGAAASVGAQFRLDGTIPEEPGVHPPEAVIPAVPFVERLLAEPNFALWEGETRRRGVVENE